MATSWWRHQMKTFSASLAICAGNSLVSDEFPTQRPMTRSFDVFFDLRLNKRLSKHWWGWWFETLSRPLWRHRSDIRKDTKYTGAVSISDKTSYQTISQSVVTLIIFWNSGNLLHGRFNSSTTMTPGKWEPLKNSNRKSKGFETS